MAKKEKVVDLKQKAEKVTEKQLTQIQSVVDRINNAQMNIGQLEARKHQLLHMIAGVNDELTLLQGELEKEYGTNDINIKDGTINYPKENGEVNKKD
tara:strand:+ start:1668 stop:1958 length:291 start_codon:yes stop_codon:yes gene_type:complete